MATTTFDRAADLVSWTQPAFGLWIASAGDSYLGMIERSTEGYFATNSLGESIGLYSELAKAKHALLPTFPGLGPRHPSLVLMIVTILVAMAVSAFAVTAFEFYLK